MATTSSLFDLDRIRRECQIDVLHWEPTVPSTNSLAIEKAGTWSSFSRVLVLTDEQTAGRGRGANQWWSTQGALTMSLWIGDGHQQLMQQLGPCSLAIGSAICDALEGYQAGPDGGRIGLKWPNDIWLGERKLGGVLVEIPSPDRGAVIGVGLNVNNSFADAPQEQQQIATSLRDTWRRELDLSDLVVRLLQQLELQLKSLFDGDSTVAEAWRARSVLDNRTVLFRIGNRSIRGKCIEIDADGALVLQTESKTERFLAGSIEQVLPPNIS